jgi:hypothetical protein
MIFDKQNGSFRLFSFRQARRGRASEDGAMSSLDKANKHKPAGAAPEPGGQLEFRFQTDIAAILRRVEARVRELFGDCRATSRQQFGYNTAHDFECGRLARELDEAASSPAANLSHKIEITLLKAQIFGCWHKHHGTESNHRSAMRCYELALRLAASLPETEARVRLCYARFSFQAPERIGGGIGRAVENLCRALMLVPEGGELYRQCSEELARLSAGHANE